MDKKYFVYILTNSRKTVFYTGITSNLIKRVWEHKNKVVEGFTSKYNISRLVYYEEYLDVHEAINREKQLKDYRRDKKLELIKKENPNLEEVNIH